MSAKKLLLVEDNEAVAMGIRYGLEKEGFQVIWSARIADAWQVVNKEPPDLIILDVSLPDGNGFDFCRALRDAEWHQPVLILTARDELIDKVLGLEIGADDYVTKPFELRELLARIRALLRRSYGPLAEKGLRTLHLGELLVDLPGQQATFQNRLIELTRTEFKLLAFLAQHPNEHFSRSDLLTNVWGYEHFAGGERTVDVHIRNLRQKIEPDPANPMWIVTVRGIGYKLAFEEGV